MAPNSQKYTSQKHAVSLTQGFLTHQTNLNNATASFNKLESYHDLASLVTHEHYNNAISVGQTYQNYVTVAHQDHLSVVVDSVSANDIAGTLLVNYHFSLNDSQLPVINSTPKVFNVTGFKTANTQANEINATFSAHNGQQILASRIDTNN